MGAFPKKGSLLRLSFRSKFILRLLECKIYFASFGVQNLFCDGTLGVQNLFCIIFSFQIYFAMGMRPLKIQLNLLTFRHH